LSILLGAQFACHSPLSVETESWALAFLLVVVLWFVVVCNSLHPCWSHHATSVVEVFCIVFYLLFSLFHQLYVQFLHLTYLDQLFLSMIASP
jgi:hypothetical protein